MNAIVFFIPILLGVASVVNYKQYSRMSGSGKIPVILDTKFRCEMYAFLTCLSLIAIFVISEITHPLV